MSGYFFIEYKDGRFTKIDFKNVKSAEKAYKLYDKDPEDNAKGWGWETDYETPTLTQQIHAKRAMA